MLAQAGRPLWQRLFSPGLTAGKDYGPLGLGWLSDVIEGAAREASADEEIEEELD